MTDAQRRAKKKYQETHRGAYLAEKKRHREKHRDDIREYRRNNTIKSSFLGENHLDKKRELSIEGKRPYPVDCLCEACDKKRIRCLQYHHWDDTDFSLGLWVCASCHNIIHRITNGGSNKRNSKGILWQS